MGWDLARRYGSQEGPWVAIKFDPNGPERLRKPMVPFSVRQTNEGSQPRRVRESSGARSRLDSFALRTPCSRSHGGLGTTCKQESGIKFVPICPHPGHSPGFCWRFRLQSWLWTYQSHAARMGRAEETRFPKQNATIPLGMGNTVTTRWFKTLPPCVSHYRACSAVCMSCVCAI